MLKILIFLVLISFLLLGFADFLHYIWQSLISPKRKPKRVYVVYLDGTDDYQTLLWLTDKIRWHGSALCDDAVAIFNENTGRELLQEFKHKGIIFVKDMDIKNYGDIYGYVTTEGNG